MAERVAPEIWISIFQYLTPVDLCFSVSPVNKLFYELSQDNQIWSLFKCNSWNEKSASLPTIKRKFPVYDNSTQSLYKNLYIYWIREQARQTRVAQNNPPNWLSVNGKRTIKIGVCGDTSLPYDSKNPELYDNKYYLLKSNTAPTNSDPKGVVPRSARAVTDISNYFPGQQVEATLHEWDLFGSRTSMERLVHRKITSNTIAGIFWCIDSYNDRSKSHIKTVNKRLSEVAPNAHLMVVDFSPMTKKDKQAPENFKTWTNEIGANFVEFADIDSALAKMVNISNLKFRDSVPKYLPTAEEFTKYVGPLVTHVL